MSKQFIQLGDVILNKHDVMDIFGFDARISTSNKPVPSIRITTRKKIEDKYKSYIYSIDSEEARALLKWIADEVEVLVPGSIISIEEYRPF